MKNILVPTDFSKCADNAAEYACKLATKIGATVHLLHVVYPSEGVDNSVYSALWIEDYLETRRMQVQTLKSKLLAKSLFRSLNITSTVQVGYPATTTAAYADEVRADLIVMGTVGATGLKGVLLGSTTGALISKTKRAVLAVPAKGSFKARAKIAFATDFDMKISAADFDTMHAFITGQQAKLHIVNILESEDMKPDKKKEVEFSKSLGDIKHDYRYIHNLSIFQGVNDFLEAVKADALIAIAHNHSLWHKAWYTSISNTLVQYCRMPVLVLHDVE